MITIYGYDFWEAKVWEAIRVFISNLRNCVAGVKFLVAKTYLSETIFYFI